ncbi:Integrin beta [Operophtera brumata]|uniref:Integrin beta n=1 Tax=Operophtera brumata TaxID=104452 RepID=A0A0L7KWE2_OPEBR|nr:Integrin beta [Operophtera brumata]
MIGRFAHSSETGAVVQIKPQLYDVKLRPGQPLKFNFSFQGAKNYPVDLYILLDVSLTMKNIKKSLASDSENIYKTMQSMTEKVNIGFGTFIDKNTQPYTLDVITKEAYSFRHRLNLTSNYKAFETVVSRTNFSYNYDSPESGFDALAQVMACDVGWRRKSRKIIVLLTDSSHHTVGDGRSAGIFQPYDGKCYTNKEGIYTKELEMDYPSVTTLNRLAIEKGVIIIFTIKKKDNDYERKKLKEIYETLKEAIRGSKTALLSNDDITEPLRESYKEISTNIKLDVVVRSGQRNNFQIKFHPDCTKKDHGDDCKVETGERRDFTGTITLTEYYGKDTELIDISVQGMTEKLTLNVEVIKCACEEDEENKADNLKYCSGQKLQCGVCICGESR